MKRRIIAAVWISLGCAGSMAFAAAEPPTAAGSQDVLVQGKSLSELRSEARKAERRFQSLYEQLNQDVQQQISCEDDAATGTRFKKRKCTTRAAENATARAAQDYVGTADLNTSSTSTQTGRAPALDAASPADRVQSTPERYVAKLDSVDLKNPQDAYRRNLEKLMNEHPELRKRYEEYVLTQTRLQAAENKGNQAK